MHVSQASQLISGDVYVYVVQEHHSSHAVYLHVLGDALGSVAVIVSAFVMMYWKVRLFDKVHALFMTIMMMITATWQVAISRRPILHIHHRRVHIDHNIPALQKEHHSVAPGMSTRGIVRRSN